MQEDALDRLMERLHDAIDQITDLWDTISGILETVNGLYDTVGKITGHRLNLTYVPQASKQHVRFSPMNRFDMCRPTSGFL